MLDLQPRVLDAAATRLLVNVAGLVAREIEGLAGPEYILPMHTKVRSCRHNRQLATYLLTMENMLSPCHPYAYKGTLMQTELSALS